MPVCVRFFWVKFPWFELSICTTLCALTFRYFYAFICTFSPVPFYTSSFSSLRVYFVACVCSINRFCCCICLRTVRGNGISERIELHALHGNLSTTKNVL